RRLHAVELQVDHHEVRVRDGSMDVVATDSGSLSVHRVAVESALPPVEVRHRVLNVKDRHRCPLRQTYSAIGGHEHIRLRSPYGLSIRPTAGQCLFSRTNGSGNAACSREYGWLHSAAVTAPAVCGAFFRTLSFGSALPSMTAWISARMAIMASQNLSSSSFASLSVGSTMIVPATGNETVGAWKP